MEASNSRGLVWELEDLTVEDFFGYTPSVALGAVAMSLYFVAALVVGYQTWRSKWRYMHTVTITGLLEAAGYAALIYAVQRSGETNIYGAYVSMQVFVILSPNLLQAADYWTVGNVLASSPALTKGRRMLSRKVIAAVFVGADLLALIIQSIGISIWASAKSDDEGDPDVVKKDVKLGSDIMLAGLAFQLFCFFLFIGLAIWVHRHPKNAMAGSVNLRKLYTGLYINMVFLTVRNIFRFVEFTQSTLLGWPPSPDTYIIVEQEVLFYTLDTLPILICFLAFILYHPGWYLLPLSPAVEPSKAREDLEACKAEEEDAKIAGGEGGVVPAQLTAHS